MSDNVRELFPGVFNPLIRFADRAAQIAYDALELALAPLFQPARFADLDTPLARIEEESEVYEGRMESDGPDATRPVESGHDMGVRVANAAEWFPQHTKNAAVEPDWAIGGGYGEFSLDEYAIEPGRGCDALLHSHEIIDVIEALPFFTDGRIIRRTVTCGPWEYVDTAEIGKD